MRCPKCGSEIQPGAKFCSICGSTLVSNNNEDTFTIQCLIDEILNEEKDD